MKCDRESRRWLALAAFLSLLLGACRSTALSAGDSGAEAQGGTPLPPRDGGRVCHVATDCTWWQDPDPASFCCAGQCTNTRDDPRNCGGCGQACSQGQVCDDGHCRAARDACLNVTCDQGWICCSGRCVSPSFYTSNCGECAVACLFSGGACRAGVCCPTADPDAGCDDLRCPDGQVLCAEGCRDITSNPLSCGACGVVCPPAQPRCVYGNCRP